MDNLKDFQFVGDHAEYRPTSKVSLAKAVQMVASAIAQARRQDIRKLLVDTRGLTGFAPPSIAERYFFVQEWARAARGLVRVAFVARREMIDPGKFGITVAANSGLIGDVFETVEEALAWLRTAEEDLPKR